MLKHTENIIQVKNLVKKFGSFVANDNLTFEVKKGEEKMLRVDRKERIDMLNKIDASTMHCCEAAEIIFEDIT